MTAARQSDAMACPPRSGPRLTSRRPIAVGKRSARRFARLCSFDAQAIPLILEEKRSVIWQSGAQAEGGPGPRSARWWAATPASTRGDPARCFGHIDERGILTV